MRALYTNAVRCAISVAYQGALRRLHLARKEHETIVAKLVCPDNLTYKEYQELTRKDKEMKQEIMKLKVECDTWDQAREICLDTADNMEELIRSVKEEK